MPISGGGVGLTGSVVALSVTAELVNLDPGTSAVAYTVTGPGITGTLTAQLGSLLLCPDGVSTAEIDGIIASGTVVNGSGSYTISGGILFKPVVVTGALVKTGSNFVITGTYAAGNPGLPLLAYFTVTPGSGSPVTVPATLVSPDGTASYTLPPTTPSPTTLTISGFMSFRACNADSAALPSQDFTFVGYCTLSDVLSQANRTDAFTDTENTRAQAAIAQAMATIDEETGTWFDDRHVQVVTEIISDKQDKLFMPAPILSVTALTEDGIALTAGTGNDYLQYDNYFRKLKTSQNFLIGNVVTPWTMWSQNPQAVVFTGHLGFASVPQDIVQLCALLAGIYMGIIERTYTTPDGVVGAVRTLKLPEWAIETFRRRTRAGWDYQPFIITAL